MAFEGAPVDTGIRLTWRTSSETNNAGFRVERRRSWGSGKEEGWTQVGIVEGGGTTSVPQAYRFVDRQVPFATEAVTYRLRQVDLDGTATLSDPVRVVPGAPTELTLRAPFPNPTRSGATLRWALPSAMEVEVGIYNVLGQRVATLTAGRQEAGRAEQHLDTAPLPPGLYFVRMNAGNQVRTQRLTVVR